MLSLVFAGLSLCASCPGLRGTQRSGTTRLSPPVSLSHESGEAAAEAAEAKLQDDLEYRETSEMVSEQLTFRVKDKAKQQKAKDFFNSVFLDVRKISSIEKSVKKIEARVTNNEVKLMNNKVTKKAVGRAVQVLGGTVLAIYYYGGWALVTKMVRLPIVSALFVYMTSRADLCESVCESANGRFRVTPRWRAFS